ncbi:hypothetical protein PRIPAC_85788 [Pristionchus pacificus]|uniref:Uncharacterized protein n=1 Tax=Pristionchus pacificus TaxID=54126 RepID=A0A2A6CIH5_PRIPA|nr:hypothetical protein PRIPAC_85788 [Pristionchus pacificus]|eukprot:PDM78025.1 hypothetical protein PRIPAC_35214 [Pristionchus pacificus]
MFHTLATRNVTPSFRYFSEESYEEDDSIVENALRDEQFECYKDKIDMENALKSVLNGGHPIEEAARVFQIDLNRLIWIHSKICTGEASIFYAQAHSTPSVENTVASTQRIFRKQRFHASPIPLSTNIPSILKRSRYESKPPNCRYLIRLVKAPIDGSPPKRVSVDGKFVEFVKLNADGDTVKNKCDEQNSSNQSMIPASNEMSFTEELTVENEDSYGELDLNNVETEVDVMTFNDDESYNEINELEELEAAAGGDTLSQSNLFGENGQDSHSQRDQNETNGNLIYDNNAIVEFSVIEKYESEIENTLKTTCERSYLSEDELDSVRNALRELLYQSDLQISATANSHNIPRSRLSSFYGRLRRKLKLPVKRNTFRLVIIPDMEQKENFVEKASLKEVQKLVRKRLVGCKKGNRSRLFQSVMRVVMGEATTAQSAAQENLHPLNVWRYAISIRNELGEKAPEWTKKMRVPVKGGREYLCPLDRHGNEMMKQKRRKMNRIHQEDKRKENDMMSEKNDDNISNRIIESDSDSSMGGLSESDSDDEFVHSRHKEEKWWIKK